jgi:hypothetical protein
VADVNDRLENYRRIIGAILGIQITLEYRYGNQSGTQGGA